MDLYRFILKHCFSFSTVQVISVSSLMPLKFSEDYCGSLFELTKKERLLKKNVISYFREPNHGKYIIMVEDYRV